MKKLARHAHGGSDLANYNLRPLRGQRARGGGKMGKKRSRPLTIDVDEPEMMRQRTHMQHMAEVDAEGPASLRDDVCCIHEVGRGASGVVSLGIFVPTLRMVAIKELSVRDETHEQQTMEELHAVHEQLVPIDADGKPIWLFHHHQSIGDVHPCSQIVSYYGSWADRKANTVSMVLEYMHGGSLEGLSAPVRSEPLLHFILTACLQALAHMQVHETLHRDIKPANILVNCDGDIKLGDLGLARHRVIETSGEGTCLYLSPERVEGKPYSFGADIWSLGITVVTLAMGCHPFGSGGCVGNNEAIGCGESNVEREFLDLADAIVNKPSPGLARSGIGATATTVVEKGSSSAGVHWIDGSEGHDGFSPELCDMVECMLAKDPNKRWCAARLMQHPFMRGREFDKSEVRDRLIKTLRVREKGQVEVHRIVEAVHTHQRLKRASTSSSEGIPKSMQPSPAVPSSPLPSKSAVTKRWRLLRNSVGPTTRSATASKISVAYKMANTWEAVVNLAHSLDVPREQLIEQLLS